MTGMLCIPMKKSYDVDIAGPIRTFISCTYSTTEMPTDFESINDFNKLRSKACVQPLDRHESSLELLYRYYDQLCGIEGKLPITPTQIPISFKWKDAFDRGGLFASKSSLTLSFSSYEKACVMFNIAGLQSQIAANQKLDTDDELKSAAKMFMQSAGFLSTLKDNVLSMVQQDPTADLMPDTLSALSALMIAQGQEAIYLKAAKDEMKPTLIAKVAAQAADFYAEAARQMGREGLRSLWDKDWLPIVNGKNLSFLALSQYHQSLVDKNNNSTADELARLSYSQTNMQQAQQHFGSVHLTLLKQEAAIIQKAYESAKKDNDFIYHERIPDIKQLTVIQKAILSKPQPPTVGQNMSRNFKDLFEKLTPIAVQMAMARYETRKSGIVQSEVGRLREHTNLMNTILASLNLPAALEDATSGEDLPDSIREKSAKVKSMGGITSIERLINDLPSLLKRNQEILDETRRLLDDEKSSDDQLRNQFKERWTRMPSETLSGPLYDELNKYMQILEKALYADKIVKEKFDNNRRGFDLLSKTELELKSSIPGINSANSGANSNGSPAVTELKRLLGEVNEIKNDREKLENDFKIKSFDMAPVFLKALADSGAVANDEQLTSDKLNEQYSPLRTTVSESIQKQEKLMEKIQVANDKFTAEKGAGVGAERENMLMMLVNAFDAFLQLSSNLQEGTKFYNDLTPLLVRLQQKVSDYCFARKTEKEDLMKDLQMNIVNQSTGSAPSQPSYHAGQSSTISTGPNQPPARPPPPKFQSEPVSQIQQQAPVQSLQPSFGQMPGYSPYGAPQNQPYVPAQNAGPYPYNLSYSSVPAGQPPQQFSSTTPYPTAPMPNYPYPQQPMLGTMPHPTQQQGQAPYPPQQQYNTWH